MKVLILFVSWCILLLLLVAPGAAGLGDYVYLADITTKRLGPLMQGQKSIALITPYSKGVGF